ncbi:MAG: N-6 DNA methylase [Bacteroides sp.]|nr:N-6 DNA methylase [Bacteroides sp.]
MQRIDMISCVGREYLTHNLENGEFSYQQVIEEKITGHYKLDLRFYDSKNKVAVLIETKRKFNVKKDKKQLFDYVSLEQKLSSNIKIVAILANTSNDNIKVWKIDVIEEELDDTKLKSMSEYVDYFKPRNINDKTTVLENTAKLNRKLLDNGIPEKLRSQFVGTCLLALKEGLMYENLSTKQINAGIKEILSTLLKNSIDKAVKLSVLQSKVIESQYVEGLVAEEYQKLLKFIQHEILPYINDASYEGHDILSYFFTTFNKYVAREDKNQAFTPNHISHFMCKIAGIHRNTRVLDPTCGSGTFLVQAMTQILRECETDSERDKVKKEQIYGIEFDESVYGLATTNMLIHQDGNSNIRVGSCFDLGDWIVDKKTNLVLMNPPYNAAKNQVPKEFADDWGKSSTDPSKGLYFVKFIADKVIIDPDDDKITRQGRLLTLLPMQCAIKTDGIIGDIKQKLMQKHTLDAVFSFPIDMFYPGASAVACCMVFDLGKPHPKDYETFFGYYREDGFEKRKGVGRVDVKNKWEETEKKWYDTYRSRLTIPGLSVCKTVTSSMEWCAEAYMETDYSALSEIDFIEKLRDYAAFLVQNELF